ncbi:Protein of unknown function DUF2115 [Methanohalobium evestigatum Z-7303]|uniref:UPF0305 protein Metev_1426 n=1 Tax=Methanohalobium evestigatum (strain ATCC BAA-1072 / DSM 3721 / NBRC 107634 / OCM 161 / Z-7303) TaxID=644295 RepID=D7E9K9_METEZ|nr:DUF2115 domain-containing protein [Methanohalobium evestigatum]ADI74281.1 Protein of unknown function DUF2115 [Methanohalobium evestigatum Z-7303]
MDTSQLFQCLKKNALKISIHDLMKAKAYIEYNNRNLPEKYQKDYTQNLFEYIFNTLIEIKNKNSVDSVEHIDENVFKDLVEKINRLNENYSPEQKIFNRLIKIVSLYLVFIAKKPIHPEGMIFPGGFKITKESGVYYCPVKNKQSGIEFALCDFCVCRDKEELETY